MLLLESHSERLTFGCRVFLKDSLCSLGWTEEKKLPGRLLAPGLPWPPPPHLSSPHSHSPLTNPFLKLNSTPPYPGQRFSMRGKIRTSLTLRSLCHPSFLALLPSSPSLLLQPLPLNLSPGIRKHISALGETFPCGGSRYTGAWLVLLLCQILFREEPSIQ